MPEPRAKPNKRGEKNSGHGSGNTIFVEFFRNTTQESDALLFSKSLAANGIRKMYIVEIFAALQKRSEELGHVPSVVDVVNAIREIK